MPIDKGYVYSIGGGLLRYEGVRQVLSTDTCMEHVFTVVKPLNNVTREVKPWNKYVTGTRHNKIGHTICIYFKRGIFKLLKYEQTLTILHGRPS